MRQIRVLVLGAGPSGLLAAEAAETLGCKVTIISRAEKSKLYGAQYLHRDIPSIAKEHIKDFEVDYQLRGYADDYRTKVYGPDSGVAVSPLELVGHHSAWDIRTAYDYLWDKWAPNWGHQITGLDSIKGLLPGGASGDFDFIFSTIPRPVFRVPGEIFHYEEVWALGDTEESRVPIMIPQNTVICDGTKDVGWYRAAHIGGYKTVEWPLRNKPPVQGVAKIKKPLSHQHDMSLPPNPADKFLTYLGRYGKWEKGVLTSDAYDETIKTIINKLDRRDEE